VAASAAMMMNFLDSEGDSVPREAKTAILAVCEIIAFVV
jgi:hypothetical protein